jgi:uncharacterized membrane protein YuzA (DUF378 family)
MIPCILGWTQYQRGTQATILAIIIIFGVQILLVAPMTFDIVAQLFGMRLGSRTSFSKYLNFS